MMARPYAGVGVPPAWRACAHVRAHRGQKKQFCGKRLRPLVLIMVEAMERHGHLRLAPEVRIRLLAMSAATIARALRNVRQEARGKSGPDFKTQPRTAS